jgi:hypothetical protein
MVGMIDSPTVSARPSLKAVLSAMRWLRRIDNTLADKAMSRTYHIFSQIDRPTVSLKRWLADIFEWKHDVRRANLFSMVDYSPKPVPVPVVYFGATFSPSAWRRLSAGIDAIKMKGNHAEVVRDPADLEVIAGCLRSVLQPPERTAGA